METTMTPQLRIANSDLVQRQVGDWVDTETSADITRSLELVRSLDEPAMTMIAGSPGIGKSVTVERFRDAYPNDTFYIEAACGEGTAWNLAKSMERKWTYPNSFQCLSEARSKFANQLGGFGRYGLRHALIVDEAQYLYQRNKKTGQNGEAMEWLRAVAEAGQFKLIFVGDMNLPAAIAKFPQLQSRMVRPVIVPEVTRTDVSALVSGSAFDTAPAIDLLHGIARREGGLRNVSKVLFAAYDFSVAGHPTLDHLKSAIADMKLNPVGQ